MEPNWICISYTGQVAIPSSARVRRARAAERLHRWCRRLRLAMPRKSPAPSTRAEGCQQCQQSCSTGRTATSCCRLGLGEKGELGALAAISPASGSRPTKAEPPAPSLVPAQQGSEAVLSSSAPLCPGSVQDRHLLLRAQGGASWPLPPEQGEVQPLFCVPSRRPIGEKSIGATGFEPAT